ncbi:MAG: tetratricopeptide repeat protein [Bacteroidales bacterium]|nr:tetratricopeptide repeat protein [Bacteroidales bacterium]
MDEDLNLSEDEKKLLDRFDQMIQSDGVYFFDSEELEIIIDCYLDNNELEKAATAIRLAFAQYPNDSYFLLKKAQYYMQTGQLDKAIQILDEGSFDPDDPEMLIIRAQIFSLKDQSDIAIQLLKRVISIDDDFKEEAYILIASEYESMNDFKQSLDWLKLALEINPENELTITSISSSYELLDRPKEAIQFFKDFLKNHPFSTFAWFSLGSFYSLLSEFEQAIDAYDYVLAIDEKFSSACFNKANALANIGRYDEAIESYQETLSLEDPESTTYYYIGECYEKKRDFSTALSYYKQALEIEKDPDHEIHCGIAVCLLELNRPELAFQFINKALEKSPENTDYWFVKADIQKRMGNLDEAVICYQKSIDLGRDDWDVWLDYSDTLMEQQNIEQGFAILAQGIKRLPDAAAIRFRIAACFAKYGKLKDAESFFAMALKMDKEGYQDAFDYYPAMKDMPTFINLVMEAEQD